MKRLLPGLLLLLAAGPAVGEDTVSIPRALDGLAWMVGGQWNSEPVLPSGDAISARMVVDWGPGRMSLRMRTYMETPPGESQTYEALLYWQPNERRVEYVTFDPRGHIYRGTGKIDHRCLVLEQGAAGGFPPMRHRYEPDPENEDRYVGTSYFKVKHDWIVAMRATSDRHEIRPSGETATPTPALAAKFGPLARLAGKAWQVSGESAGASISERTRFEGSLGGSLLVARTTTKQGDLDLLSRLSVSWWDPEAGQVRFLACSENGTVARGGYTFAEDGGGWSLEWESLEPGGRTTTFRETVDPADEGSLEMKRFEQRDGNWEPVQGRIVAVLRPV